MQIYLFVYGQLKNNHSPPSTTKQVIPDQAKGVLYDFGHDAHARFEHTGIMPYWFDGETLVIEESELKSLDSLELHAQFKRIKIETKKHFSAWTYEYTGPIPPNSRIIRQWH